MFYILKMDHSKILGVVLAGGKSLRFGEDKSQVKLNNKSLIDHILSEILTEFKELLIVSNNSIEFNKSENISIISDFKNNLGPLGSVLTAMKWIKDNNKDYQWISTFPTDTPFFKNQILKDFHDKINLKNGKLFFIKSNNTRHNIFEKDLENVDRKVEDWANKVGVNIIDMQFEKNDPFFNINTKKDLEKAKV